MDSDWWSRKPKQVAHSSSAQSSTEDRRMIRLPRRAGHRSCHCSDRCPCVRVSEHQCSSQTPVRNPSVRCLLLRHARRRRYSRCRHSLRLCLVLQSSRHDDGCWFLGHVCQMLDWRRAFSSSVSSSCHWSVHPSMNDDDQRVFYA